MQPCADVDRDAELALIGGRLPRQSVEGSEADAPATGLHYAIGELPGGDQLVADITADFASRGDDWRSEIGDETVEPAAEGALAAPLGDSSRTRHIDEQEYAFLAPRSMIAAGSKIEQHVPSEHLVDLEEEVKDKGCRERERYVPPLKGQP